MENENNYNPLDRNIYMWNSDLVYEKLGLNGKYGLKRFEKEINELLDNPKMSPYIQLQKWRKLGKQMYEMIKIRDDLVNASYDQLKRISDSTATNANKRWTKEDDEMLIDLVCGEKYSLIEIASIFGRSTTAISTRISYLVGINRISKEIAGKFEGLLNGEKVQGDIKGTITK